MTKNKINKYLAAMFHCDNCGKETMMIDTGDGLGKNCPFCKSNKCYDFDDLYMTPAEKKRKI